MKLKKSTVSSAPPGIRPDLNWQQRWIDANRNLKFEHLKMSRGNQDFSVISPPIDWVVQIYVPGSGVWSWFYTLNFAYLSMRLNNNNVPRIKYREGTVFSTEKECVLWLPGAWEEWQQIAESYMMWIDL